MTTAPLEPHGDDREDRAENVPLPDDGSGLPATPEDPTVDPDAGDDDAGTSPPGMPEDTPFRTPEVPD
jgi:hypothetical protein